MKIGDEFHVNGFKNEHPKQIAYINSCNDAGGGWYIDYIEYLGQYMGAVKGKVKSGYYIRVRK